MIPTQSIPVTATATAFTGQGALSGAVLAADAGAAAVVTIRDVDASGTILLKLTAAQGTTVVYDGPPIRFTTAIHVTLAGASAHVNVMI